MSSAPYDVGGDCVAVRRTVRRAEIEGLHRGNLGQRVKRGRRAATRAKVEMKVVEKRFMVAIGATMGSGGGSFVLPNINTVRYSRVADLDAKQKIREETVTIMLAHMQLRTSIWTLIHQSINC